MGSVASIQFKSYRDHQPNLRFAVGFGSDITVIVNPVCGFL